MGEVRKRGNAMQKKVLEMEDVLLELDVANKKACIVIEDICNNYFGDACPEEWFLKMYYESTGVKAAILSDYIAQTSLIISRLRSLIETHPQ